MFGILFLKWFSGLFLQDNSFDLHFSKKMSHTKGWLSMGKGIDPIVCKTATSTLYFGFRSFFIAAGYVALMEIMSDLGPDQEAASNVVSTIQGVIAGIGAGFSTGVASEISAALGSGAEESYISNVIKVGGIQVLGLSAIFAAICWTIRLWLPLVLANKHTALEVAGYFEGYSAAPFFELLILALGQIVFKLEKNAWLAFISSTAYRAIGSGLAYGSNRLTNMGTLGIGLSYSIASAFCVLCHIPWFLRKRYRSMEDLYTCKLSNTAAILKKTMGDGWKLALHRMTEWGNLFIIVQIVGAWSNSDLIAFQPSMMVCLFMELLVQGCSVAGMLTTIENNKRLAKRLAGNGEIDSEGPSIKALLTNSKKYFWITNLIGLSVTVVLASVAMATKVLIINATIPPNMTNTTAGGSESISNLASYCFIVRVLSSLPDSFRVISSTMLKSWDNILFAIINSVINMSAIGIPLAYLIGSLDDFSILPFFYVRGAAVTVSASINVGRYLWHLSSSNKCNINSTLS